MAPVATIEIALELVVGLDALVFQVVADQQIFQRWLQAHGPADLIEHGRLGNGQAEALLA